MPARANVEFARTANELEVESENEGERSGTIPVFVTMYENCEVAPTARFVESAFTDIWGAWSTSASPTESVSVPESPEASM